MSRLDRRTTLKLIAATGAVGLAATDRDARAASGDPNP